MSKHQHSQKWYQQQRWILGSLLLFPPLGIPLLWLTRWPRAGKIGGSIVSGILLLSVLTGESSEPNVAIAEPSVIEAAKASMKVEPVASTAYEAAIAEATAATTELIAAESSEDWARIASQWQLAHSSLGDIPLSSDDYRQAQVKIAEYERNYDYAIAQKAAVEAAEVEAIAQRQAEEAAIAQQQAVAQEAETVMPMVETQGGGYVSGTCAELKASGVGGDLGRGMRTIPRRGIETAMASPANLENF